MFACVETLYVALVFIIIVSAQYDQIHANGKGESVPLSHVARQKKAKRVIYYYNRKHVCYNDMSWKKLFKERGGLGMNEICKHREATVWSLLTIWKHFI